MSDPLPQAFVLTAIVITLAVTAFLLTLAYRSFQIAGHDEVSDDVEDAAIRRLAVDDETSGSYDDDVEGHPDETGQATGEEEGERVTADPEGSDADPGLGGSSRSRPPRGPEGRPGPGRLPGHPDDGRGTAVNNLLPAARAAAAARGRARARAQPPSPWRSASSRRSSWSSVTTIAALLVGAHRRARTARAVGRQLAAAARDRARRRPAERADAARVVGRHAVGAAVLHGRTGGGTSPRDADLDLLPDVPGAVGRRLQRLPRRRPVQPVRRLRDAALRLVRAAHPRRDGRARAGREHVRPGQPAVLDAVPGRDRRRVRGHGHGQPRAAVDAAARPAARRRAGAAAAAAHGVLDQGRGLPDVGLAPGLLPDRAGPGDGGVRRPADQGRRVRDHPDADPALRRQPPDDAC